MIGNDPLKPNESYFTHVDWVIKRAEEKGLFIGLLPTWGDKLDTIWGIGPIIFNKENAFKYGQWIGNRYKDFQNIIWINGGDRDGGGDNKVIWEAIGKGIKSVDKNHLMTFHPRGNHSSSEWFQESSWLDFNMCQSGRKPQSLNYIFIEKDYALEPLKPTFDGEPAYEYPPHNMPEERPIDAFHVRRNAYWAAFAGAHGHTYGTHPIWQMFDTGHKPLWKVVTPWHQALDLPGATQLVYMKRLLLNRPFLTRIPDQTVIVSAVPEGIERIQATRDGQVNQNDASYILAYFPQHNYMTLNTGRISADTLNIWWLNPRNGEATLMGKRPNTITMEFEPPTRTPGDDWVLVIDDAAQKFYPPDYKKE